MKILMTSSIKNELSDKYSKGTIFIHWVTALLIIILFPLGKYMEGIDVPEKMGLIKIHIILGIIVFFLTIIRSWLFFKSSRPAYLNTGSKLTDNLAVYVHNIFYFLLFGIAVSGIAAMFLGGYYDAIIGGSVEVIKSHEEIPPLKGHGLIASIIMLLLLMHVVGVIKHYILLKENTLKRIF